MIVRNTDDSIGRMNAFNSFLPHSRKIRYSYTLYQYAPEPLKGALIILYGLKCYLSLAWTQNGKQQLIFFASYPNEKHVLCHVKKCLQSIGHGEITISIRNCLSFQAIAELVSFAPSSIRLYRFARRLARRHDFMPACRIFSTVAYYMRFKRMLSGSAAKAVFIANQYSPECLGLATAAHQLGRKVLFTNHANATGEIGFVAPLHADLVAVTSEALADLYRRHTPHELNIVTLPIASRQGSMRAPDDAAHALVVGIYLTALTDETRLRNLVARLHQLPFVDTIFIRGHPVPLVNAGLAELRSAGGLVEISRSRPLHKDIARTDIAVCGNSTVTIEILRGGRPVLYDHRLDGLPHDYNGYAGHQLVLPIPEQLDRSLLAKIRRHYLDRAWSRRMRYFDSGYQGDEMAMWQGLKAAVVQILHRQ